MAIAGSAAGPAALDQPANLPLYRGLRRHDASSSGAEDGAGNPTISANRSAISPFIGVCGLRPYQAKDPARQGQTICELGVHLLPDYWHAGYAFEAARRTMDRAFDQLSCHALFAGHNPKNTASRGLLLKLGFRYDHDEFYPPTGLYHPSYFFDP